MLANEIIIYGPSDDWRLNNLNQNHFISTRFSPGPGIEYVYAYWFRFFQFCASKSEKATKAVPDLSLLPLSPPQGLGLLAKKQQF